MGNWMGCTTVAVYVKVCFALCRLVVCVHMRWFVRCRESVTKISPSRGGDSIPCSHVPSILRNPRDFSIGAGV